MDICYQVSNQKNPNNCHWFNTTTHVKQLSLSPIQAVSQRLKLRTEKRLNSKISYISLKSFEAKKSLFKVSVNLGKTTTTRGNMTAKFNTFKAFYPFYLSQHQNSICRKLHFVGILLGVIFLLVVVFIFNNYFLLPFSLVWGYAFGWVGHFFFEKNKPTSFQYPFYSFRGDFVMFKDMLVGKIKN